MAHSHARGLGTPFSLSRNICLFQSPRNAKSVAMTYRCAGAVSRCGQAPSPGCHHHQHHHQRCSCVGRSRFPHKTCSNQHRTPGFTRVVLLGNRRRGVYRFRHRLPGRWARSCGIRGWNPRLGQRLGRPHRQPHHQQQQQRLCQQRNNQIPPHQRLGQRAPPHQSRPSGWQRRRLGGQRRGKGGRKGRKGNRNSRSVG